MPQTRTASPTDAALIASHRRAMFAAMGQTQNSILDAMERNCVPWLTRMIVEGKYIGWITEEDNKAIASAGFLVLDWPPHPLDHDGEHRGYLLNVFVQPDYRRRGHAHALVEQCLAEAHRRRIRVVTLHSSDAGRPLYETIGFRPTSEMLYVEPDEA